MPINRVKITTNNNLVLSNSANLPLEFELSNISANQFWSNIKSNGDDLLVYWNSPSGLVRCPLEIVYINTTAKTGQVYFTTSGSLNVSGSSATNDFYLYWGDPSSTQPSSGNTYGYSLVWNPTYLRVWHLQSGTSSNTMNVVESVYGHNARILNTAASKFTSGFIGSAFSGDNDTGLGLSANTQLKAGNLITSGNVSSWQWWIKPHAAWNSTTLVGKLKNVISKGSTTNEHFWIYFDEDGAPKFQYYNGEDLNVIACTCASWNINTWYKMDFVLDNRTGLKNGLWYINGNFVNSAAGLNVITEPLTNVNEAIGRHTTTGVGEQDGGFGATIDEIRIRKGLVNANWIKTIYNYENNNTNFWTVGTVETIEVESINFYFRGIWEGVGRGVWVGIG